MNKWTRIQHHPNLPLGADGRRVTASPEHIALSRAAAREGMVLLKNDFRRSPADSGEPRDGRCAARPLIGPNFDDNRVLPLRRGAKVALFGKGSYDYVKGGGGSGDVTVPYTRCLAEGMKLYPERATLFGGTDDFYREYVAAQYAAGRAPGMIAEPELPDELVRRAAAFADAAVISISRFSGEAWDRKSAFDRIEKHKGVWQQQIDAAAPLFPRGDFVLTAEEEAMVAKVKAAFDAVIVVLNVGGVFDTSWFKDDPGIAAALLGWQAGLEGGAAEAELLLGLDNPSGRLADTFAATLEDYPSSPTFYESDDYVNYEEDIYVGYRYFETVPGAAAKVNYPFGYGLSYTRFELADVRAAAEGGEIAVRASVTNAGGMAGREVVQVYFSAPQGRLGRPARQLAGWQKTRVLQPGETQRVEIRFPAARMAAYDDLGKVAEAAWVLEAGEYRFFAGANVRDAADCGFGYVVEADTVVEQLAHRMAPVQLEKRMRADGSYEPLPLGEPRDPNATALERPADDEDYEAVHPATRARPRFKLDWDGGEGGPKKLIDVAEGRISLDDFVAQLSDEDLAWLLGGQPNAGVANTFGYGNLPEYGVPCAMTADGPAGLRIQPEVGVKTTAFPCATLLACTWNPETAEAVGRAAGEEVKENNIGAWLAPGVNIHRNPLCGRNFEYYSEDPLLTGHLAGALVRGVQSNGVAATAKHFALNNKETNRKNADSRTSERAIREIYLKAFEIIVREYGVWSIMTSYNVINGCRASENRDMLTGILREEWGFDGMVTTDWWTFGEHYKECAAGNDMKMGCGYPDRLLAAMEKGALTRADLEKAAKNVLGLILRMD